MQAGFILDWYSKARTYCLDFMSMSESGRFSQNCSIRNYSGEVVVENGGSDEPLSR
jgi:hypothetical protein